jgi:transcriptional regulator with XRE-family HTH domain
LRSNLTQKALSERAQVGEVTVRRLEGGQGISLHNYLKVAFALGAVPSASDLLPQREPETLEEIRPVQRKRARKRAQTR